MKKQHSNVKSEGRKTVTISLGALKQVEETLNHLFKQKLPALVAFKVASLNKAVQNELSKCEDIRKNLVIQHGEKYKDESGQINIPSDSSEYASFMEDYIPLLKKEINLDFEAFTREDLSDVDLTADQALSLLAFLD